MFKNIFYDTRRSIIHLWEQIDGRNIYNSIHWVPYIFKENNNGKYKTIDGKNVDKIKFDTYNTYWSNIQECPNDIHENTVRPEIQFLTEKYYDIPDDEIVAPKLRTFYIDIEVHKDIGFPSIIEAEDPVVVVSIYDDLEKHTTTFGIHPFHNTLDGVTYVYCKDEKTLLINLFNFFKKNQYDVLSGWYIYNFDLPYLIARTQVLFGEDTNLYKSLSPINIMKTWKEKSKSQSLLKKRPDLSSSLKMDIAGVSILDYLDIYKWYSPSNLERHSLDFVCKFELGKGKVDFSEYGNLRNLYRENWDLYVEYNVVDAKRVGQLEEKLEYIKLVQALSLLCKSPMKNYHAMTQLIEGLMLTYYRRNDLCAPHFWGGRSQETFEAAYVKEPISGIHDWVIDLDITSSYPSHIITLNMSPETYYGRIIGIQETEVMKYTSEKKFPEFSINRNSNISRISGKNLRMFNSAVEKRLFSIAPCGSIFKTSPLGIFSIVERNVFEKRANIKSKIYKLRNSLSELEGDDYNNVYERATQLTALQQALKIILNALFGVTSVPYSRYFNPNISEAITSCGRQTIKAGERIANKLLNNPTSEIKDILEDIKKLAGNS
jgi:DNA polymerase elongation subunit (family B)